MEGVGRGRNGISLGNPFRFSLGLSVMRFTYLK
jgi:hypothetical protein